MAIYDNNRDPNEVQFHIKNSNELSKEFEYLEKGIWYRFIQLCAKQDTIKLDSGDDMLDVRSDITGEVSSAYPLEVQDYRIRLKDVNDSDPDSIFECKLEDLYSTQDKLSLLESMEQNIIKDE